MSSSALTIQYSPGVHFLRSCAVYGLDLALDEQCSTNQCVCGSDLPSVLNAVSTAVDGRCTTNRYDATSAMFAVIQYCTVQGYSVPSSLASITTSSGNTQTLSIASGQDTPNLPSCAQFPFFEVCDMIGCSTNNCFCRADIMQSAMASMSVSVSDACSGGGVQSAMQAVESYCVGNGFAVTGVTSFSAESTGTPAAAVSSFVLPGASTNVISSTATSSPSSATSHLTIILPSTIIPITILLLAAIWFFSRSRQRPAGGFMPNVQHITAPGSTFVNIGRDQNNITRVER